MSQQPLLLWILMAVPTVPLQSGAGIGISQGRCRITGTEQILPVFSQNPHLPKFRAAEYLQIQIFLCCHMTPSFSGQFGGPLTVRWFAFLEKNKKSDYSCLKRQQGIIALCTLTKYWIVSESTKRVSWNATPFWREHISDYAVEILTTHPECCFLQCWSSDSFFLRISA